MVNNETRTSSFPFIGRPLACGLLLIAGLFRFVPYLFPIPAYHLMPVGALAIFGGARMKWGQALAVPLLLMVVTDLLLWPLTWQWKSYGPFDPFVYFSFMINVLLGRTLLSQTESPVRIGLVSVLASVQFFLVTNFGAWVSGYWSSEALYSMDANGLLNCYIAGLVFNKAPAPPLGFFGHTLLSDLGFAAALFGAHAFLTRTAFPAERVQSKPDVSPHGIPA
jgi:hypothetical protein